MSFYAEAVEAYKKALEINLDNESVLYELAYCLDITGELESSISYYKKFIDADPYSHYAWYNLGIVYNKLEKYDEAVQAYGYATLIDETFASAYFNMGNSYMGLNKFTEAMEAYRQTEKLEGPSAEIYFCQGAAYEKIEQFELAIKYYRKAVKLDIMYDEALFGIGICLNKQDKWYEAIHFLNKALRMNPENPQYWQAVAEAEFKTGNILSSLDAYEEASSLDPSNIDIWLDWSFILYEQGDYEKAVELVLRGIEESPEASELYYRITAYLIIAGKYKEAFNYLENALVLNFENHQQLFEFFPRLETQKALFKIIDQYRK